MPDAVEVAHAFVEQEEADAGGIGGAAGHQPVQAGTRQGGGERIEREQHQPAHDHVDRQGQDARAVADPQFLDDADDRQAPVDAEQRPAPGAAQRD
ncbi:hypothetical protein D3C85_1301100 [compost metagenome]